MMTTRLLTQVLAASAVLGCLAGASSARELTFSTYLPPNHPTSQGIDRYAEHVSENTGGEYSVKVFAGGSLTSASTTLESIRDGVIDGGVVLTVYTPSETPANALLTDLASEEQDSRVLSAAVVDTILNDCPDCLEEFERNNIHFLASYSTPTYSLMCQDELTEDIKLDGLRVRVPGGELGNRMSELGAIPVNIPNSEAYEAMERNALDCVLGPISWMKTFSLSEVVQSVVDYPMGGYQGGTIVNVHSDVWSDPSDEDRAIFQAGAAKAIAETTYIYINDEEQVRATAEKAGIKRITPGAAFREVQSEYIADQVERLSSERADRVPNAQAIITAYHENIEKWNEMIPAGSDISQEEFEQLLNENLFQAD